MRKRNKTIRPLTGPYNLAMKNTLISLFFYAATLCFLNFRFADDFSEFGITTQNVQERLWSSLQHSEVIIPYLNNTVKSACRAISPENQAAAVQKIGKLVKHYYVSDEFKKRYADWLVKSFPQVEVGVSEQRQAEIRARRIKETGNLNAKDIEPIVDIQIQSAETFVAMEGMLSSLPADQRADFKKQIETGKQNAAFFKKIKPLLKTDFEAFKKQYAEHLAQEDIAQTEQQLSSNNKHNKAEYEKLKSPEKVLSARLMEFLEKSKGVDFSAQTKEVNNQKKFVNKVYETKNDIWKFCYRVGPAPTNAARAFAQQWLAELK